MLDFRNNKEFITEEESKLRDKINKLVDKLDALEIIKALKYRLENEKKGSFTIGELHSERVFYKLSSILVQYPTEEKSAYVFEGPSQINYTYNILLNDGSLLKLTLMEITNERLTTYKFATRYSEVNQITKETRITKVDDLNSVIDEYGRLYYVDKYAYKGKSRTRNQ